MGAKSGRHRDDYQFGGTRTSKQLHFSETQNRFTNRFDLQRKCDMYWPKEGVETHGVIQVKLVNEDARATYTIRTFSIKHLKVLKASYLISPVLVNLTAT